MAGTRLSYSSGYHPETNGQTEVVTGVLRLTFIALLEQNQGNGLGGYLQPNIGSTLPIIYPVGMKPFKALYGQDCPTLFKLEDVSSSVEDVIKA